MDGGGLIESGCYDLSVDTAAHIGHLLGTLVDEEHYYIGVGMVLRDRIGDVLQQDCLTGFRRRDDEGSLSLANRGEHIDHTCGDTSAAAARERELLVREEGYKMLERHTVAYHLGRKAVDGDHTAQRIIFLAGARGPYSALHHVTGLESELADLLLRNVNVVRAGKIIIVA